MGPFYKEVVEKLQATADVQLVAAIEYVAHRQQSSATPAKHRAFASCRAKNKQKLEEFDAKITKNKEGFGDAEVFDVSCAKAEYLAQIGATVSEAFCASAT